MKRLYLILAAILAIALPLGIALSTCSTPDRGKPLPVTDSRINLPVNHAISTASASQTVRITIRKPQTKAASGLQPSTLSGALQATFEGAPVRSDPPESGDDEVITIEMAQTVGAGAASHASIPHSNASSQHNAHGRIGVLAGTLPGVLALDYQAARVDVPPWLLGMPLELGVDVAVNLEAGAIGVTAGGKGFAGLYGYSRWDLSDQGVALGAGLRF